MKSLVKVGMSVLGAISSAAAGVAVLNAVRAKTDEEVGHEQSFYEKYAKRPFDFFCASAAAVTLSPILISTALCIRYKLGSPVLFTQERPGINGENFKIYKFRTMLDPQTRDGRKLTDSERLECVEKGIDILSDDERLTSFGRVLRATSIDELPELFNIIKGDMSIVGPRPLATIYIPYYTKKEMRRHEVRPGLTGIAQVHGRNSSSWEEKFEYDVSYVDNCSLLIDIKTILQTIFVVLKREGIGQGDEKPEAFNVIRQRQIDEGVIKESDLNHQL
ncbi:MAG: sugar transferase [Firmicutes bacterium]|nr:sugar transferase [Bacillota bacterium]